MFGRAIISLLLGVVFFLTLSCTKLPEWADSGEGDIATEKLQEIGSIPLKWGNLVSANLNPSRSYYCQLWFQDENGSLRTVIYDMRINKLITNGRLIPRK